MHAGDRNGLLCLILAVGLCAYAVGGRYGSGPPAQIMTQDSVPISQDIMCKAGTKEDSFPWPKPPKGSDEKRITEQVKRAITTTMNVPEENISLGDVDEFIRNWLKAARGSADLTYYATPNIDGYVAVAAPESIDQTGRVVRAESVAGLKLIIAITSSFFTLPKGHFRTFVFFVTPQQEIQTQWDDKKPVTHQGVSNWLAGGCQSFPPQLAGLSFGRDYIVLLRVYEIESNGSESHLVTGPRAIHLWQHFDRMDGTQVGLTLDDLK